MYKSFVILTFLLLTDFAQAQLQERMLQIAAEEFGETGFNGVVGIVTSEESIALTNGFENEVSKLPISHHTVFSLASLTKNFTAFALLERISDGKIIDSAAIGDWFPCLDSNLAAARVHHLANQSAAIADFYATIKQEQYLTNDSVMNFVCGLDSTVYKPGQTWGYSNTHYFLIAKLLERQTDMTFESILAQEYFETMKMFTAGFAYNGAEYTFGNLKGKPTKYGAAVSGEGGIVASAEDMMSFGNAIINDSNYKELLQLAYDLSDVYPQDTNWRYGYSWFFSEDEHGKFCANSGRGYGFNTYHRWYYESDVYYFVLSNKDNLRFKPFRNRIVELIDF
jgi:CubicO group peptidase (beta-lactamase class C family)